MRILYALVPAIKPYDPGRITVVDNWEEFRKRRIRYKNESNAPIKEYLAFVMDLETGEVLQDTMGYGFDIKQSQWPVPDYVTNPLMRAMKVAAIKKQQGIE